MIMGKSDMSERSKVGLIGRALRRAGYVSEARARELSDALARAEERLTDSRKALEAAKKEIQELKEKVRERSERSQQERSENEARYQARIAKVEQGAERIRQRDVERTGRLKEMRESLHDAHQRISWADKSTQLGREHLMAIEVKLDIVEGAIKVLDQRTRAALSASRDGRDGLRAPGRLP
jgi:chromosome segregation ATPase